MTSPIPCPFCGSTNLRYDFCASQGCIVCDDCDAVGPSDPRAADPICDDDAAVAAWNRRVTLAQPTTIEGPAVPEGREPAAVAGEPSDEELLATLDKATADFPPRHPEAKALNAVEYPLALELRKARAVLARWETPNLAEIRSSLGDAPAPPAPAPAGDAAIGDEWRPCVKLPITVHVREQRPGETHVSTREGITPIRPDDLIMRGVMGEEYPIGRELFERTYRLSAAPVPAEGGVGQPSDAELESFLVDVAAQHGDIYWAEPLVLARAVLARYGRPAPAPAGEVGRWDAELEEHLAVEWPSLTMAVSPPAPEPEVVGPTMQLPEQAPDEHPPSNLDRREIAAWYHGHGCGWQAARAALAALPPDGPAVPEGREPAAVAGEPSDEELDAMERQCYFATEVCNDSGCEYLFEHRRFARSVLARWGRPAPAPAGEAAKLTAEIRHFLNGYRQMRGLDPENIYSIQRGDAMEAHITVSGLTRVAALLERQSVAEESSVTAPVPVAVSERLPGPEDCDAEGRCWWFLPSRQFKFLDQCARWSLMMHSPSQDDRCRRTHWLPANALPLPSGEVEA